MIEKLKPCECGAEGEELYACGDHWVACTVCPNETVFTGCNPDKARELWNRGVYVEITEEHKEAIVKRKAVKCGR